MRKRETFARQAADLWRVKQLLHAARRARTPARGRGGRGRRAAVAVRLVPVARVPLQSRAAAQAVPRARRRVRTRPDRGVLFYGYRVHLRCSDRGFCYAATLARKLLSHTTAVLLNGGTEIRRCD